MHSTFNINDGYFGSGKRLWYSIKKHGKKNHIKHIIEFCSNREILRIREQEIVNKELLNDPMCMNLVIGGGKSWTLNGCKKGGKSLADKVKADPEFKKILIKNINKNRIIALKSGKLLPPSFKGKHHSENSKMLIGQKNSIHQSGEKNSQFGKCWIYNDELMISKSIKKEELDVWISKNWKKGRKYNS